MSITGTLKEAMAEAAQEQQREYLGFVREHLSGGEQIQAMVIGYTRMPFLLRIIPLMPDLLTRAKNHALVVTNQRFLIVRIVRGLTANKGSELVASIAFSDLRKLSLENEKATMETTSGRKYRFKGVGAEGVERLGRAIQQARRAASVKK